MKFFLASLVWIAMGVILAIGILLAVKGNPWLLIIGLLGFVVAVGKIGCALPESHGDHGQHH